MRSGTRANKTTNKQTVLKSDLLYMPIYIYIYVAHLPMVEQATCWFISNTLITNTFFDVYFLHLRDTVCFI